MESLQEGQQATNVAIRKILGLEEINKAVSLLASHSGWVDEDLLEDHGVLLASLKQALKQGVIANRLHRQPHIILQFGMAFH